MRRRPASRGSCAALAHDFASIDEVLQILPDDALKQYLPARASPASFFLQKRANFFVKSQRNRASAHLCRRA
jgi:hypothetical protein